MKIIVTIKSGKGNKSNTKDVNKSVDIIENKEGYAEIVEEKHKEKRGGETPPLNKLFPWVKRSPEIIRLLLRSEFRTSGNRRPAGPLATDDYRTR